MPAVIVGGPLIVSAKSGSIPETMPVPFAKNCSLYPQNANVINIELAQDDPQVNLPRRLTGLACIPTGARLVVPKGIWLNPRVIGQGFHLSEGP